MAISFDTVQRVRIPGLDAARGLAIVFMMVDHLCVVFDGPVWLRWSVGRMAMPIFFVLAGYLARRVSARTVAIGAAGVLLPLAVPWVDSPNVLVWWAVGCVLIVACRWWIPALWAVVLLALTWGANGVHAFGPEVLSFEPVMLLGLMAAGALASRRLWGWSDRLPRWLCWPGRHAIWVYIGHLLLLQAWVVWS